MNEEEREKLNRIENLLAQFVKSDRFIFWKTQQILDGRNYQFGKTTGTKFGTATDQLIGFYNTTPVNQPDTVSDVSGQTNDLDTEARATIAILIDRLQELGLIA